MTIKRRTFLGALALLLTNRKNVFASTSTNELSEFQKLLNLELQPINELADALMNEINNQLSCSWKGYSVETKHCFGVANKILIPIHLKTLNNSTIDYALLCFENIDNQWIKLSSLSSFHIESIIEASKVLPKYDFAKAVLPIYSKANTPNEFRTELGNFNLKMICSHERSQINFKIEIPTMAIERSIDSKTLR